MGKARRVLAADQAAALSMAKQVELELLGKVLQEEAQQVAQFILRQVVVALVGLEL